MEIFESLLRVALVVGLLWFGLVLVRLLTDSASPLRSLCLGCDRELQRVDVVHCSDCLGV